MTKNISKVFLSVLLATAMTISPIVTNTTLARTVTDQNINSQQTVVRTASRTAIEEYVRLILYMIILNLENRIDNS